MKCKIKNQIKFSVIIPAYNCELYIEKSLHSLLGAEINTINLEVIIVNDGSPNNKIKYIIEKYTPKLKILYIEKNNGNWGSVINYVKKNKLATGDIISILDSDDFYSKNVFKYIEKYSKNADLIIGNFKKFNGYKTTIKIYTYLSIFSHIIKNHYKKITPFCLPLVYFFKNELFYNLKDLEENISYQDGDINTQLLKLSKNTKYINRVLGYYYYNRDGNSMSESWDHKRLNSLIIVCRRCIVNDSQEQVIYKLFANKKLREYMGENNLKFEIQRKFHFLWFPIPIRWIFTFYSKIKFYKYFILK